jgi:uncharacterized protein (TIGR00297 family)
VRRWLLAAGLGGAFGLIAYQRRTLTADGALAAALVGGVVFARGGVPASAVLLAFFGSSSALSKFGERRKQQSPLAQAKGSQRDMWQVLANGGIATLSIGRGNRAGFVGAIAAAGADTWATELGLLATSQPRLITSLQRVEPGTSGGITAEGLAASVGGALSVGLAWSLVGGDWQGLPVAIVAGTCGSLIDSWLGATLQALYRCPACGVMTEESVHTACGGSTELVKGQRWVSNDTVNALATLAGAGIGTLTWLKLTERGGARGGGREEKRASPRQVGGEELLLPP